MKDKNQKNKRCVRVGVTVAMFLFVCVFVVVCLRFLYPKFRYQFDVLFHCCEEHVSYVEGDTINQVKLPLPPRTAFAYRTSDTASVYCTKNNYEQFLGFYRNNGYEVEGSVITSKEKNRFLLEVVAREEENSLTFIKVDIIFAAGEENGEQEAWNTESGDLPEGKESSK